jgi:hypothetical protein
MRNRYILLLVLSLTISSTGWASTCTTVAAGAFTAPSVWDCGCDPTSCDTLEIAHAVLVAGNHVFANSLVHIDPIGSLLSSDTLTFIGVLVNDGLVNAQRMEQPPGGVWIDNSGAITASTLWLWGDSCFNAGTMTGADTLDVGTNTYMTNQGRLQGGFLWGGTIINYDTVHFIRGLFDRGLDNYHFFKFDGLVLTYSGVSNAASAILETDSIVLFSNLNNYGIIHAEHLLQFGTSTNDNGYIDFLSSQATITCGNLKNYGTIQGFGDICVQDSSINYATGVITGSPDICDATLSALSEPYLDVNLGTVGLAVNWCAQTSCITSTNDLHGTKSGLTTFPNPATDQITFSGLPGTGPWSIQLFDLEGRAHAIRTEAKGEGLILLRGALAAGCYTLVIAADDARSRSVARVVFVDR